MSLVLNNSIRTKIDDWRKSDYACEYPAISEILNYNILPDEDGSSTSGYLRNAQFEALETYWYLRIVEKTPHVIDLYTKYFRDAELFSALEIRISQEDLIAILKHGMNSVFDKIKSDDAFAKKYHLENLRETLTLSYPSYILALAMGAGKTVLIGSIIATEFSMAMEYPQADFVKNALVFAPGKTILGALKEVSDIPFEKILPPRMYATFLSSAKITYTKDGEKDIPIIKGSRFNIVVTNTEKIRIQKPTTRSQLTLLNFKEKESVEMQEEIANLRLQTLASLPNLAIFSDEAHHTYGQSLDAELKKVRKTVDYLAENTNVVCVVNTTGTPYYKKSMLKDVVYWYGLAQGIQDGILKEVRNNIISYEDAETDEFLRLVLKDFVNNYGSHRIFDGAWAKLAIYFPQTDDLEKSKPIVERILVSLGMDPSVVLDVHNRSPDSVKDLFNNRVNDPSVPYRIFLLVNMGTEGWNCPSLYATALARKLTTSNNFVLQAATRCLRQVRGNNLQAKIYLAKENVKVLDSQLQETFGQSLAVINAAQQEKKKARLVIRKAEITPITVRKKLSRIVLKESRSSVVLTKPSTKSSAATEVTYVIRERPDKNKLLSESKRKSTTKEEDLLDIYYVATELASQCRINAMEVYEMLRAIYPEGDMPLSHAPVIKEQIDGQVRKYAIEEEEVEISLALLRLDGFEREERDGLIFYTAEIMYRPDKENLLLQYQSFKESNKREFGFHYSPYNFDTNPEKDFFVEVLNAINENPDDIEDVYFTGAITDASKTDFLFEYKDKNYKWRTYTPDFLVRKKDGNVLIVEVKGPPFRDETKEMAIKQIENLNPDKLKYEILITGREGLQFHHIDKVKKWIYNEKEK
jgi:hypothetical protein